MSKDDDEDDSANIGVGRYPCMPSLVALQQMRNRLHLAYLGKKLMKWTALATGRELRRVAVELNMSYGDFAEELANCYILLARCRYYYPSLNDMVIEDIQKQAYISLATSVKAVSAGVKCVTFEIIEEETPPYPHMGIEKGGQTIKETKLAWLNLLKKMILILQLRDSFRALEDANRAATKKKNVLDKLVIPKTQATVKYIMLELEELSREELYRIKKVVQNKKKRAEKAQPKPEPPPSPPLIIIIPPPSPPPIIPLPPPPPPSPPKLPPSPPRIIPTPVPPPLVIRPEPCVKVCRPPSQTVSGEDVSISQPCTSSICLGSTSAYGKPRSFDKIMVQLDSEKTMYDQRVPMICKSLEIALERSLSKASDLQLRQTKSEQRIVSSGSRTDLQMLRRLCQAVKSKITDLFPAEREGFTERLIRLKNGITEMKSTCCSMQSKTKYSLNELVKKGSQVSKRIDSLMGYKIEQKIGPDSASGSYRPVSENLRSCQVCSRETSETTTYSRPTLDDLRHSIVGTMDLVNRIKREGLLVDSMTNLMNTLSSTRRAIAKYNTVKKSSRSVEPSCLCDLCICTAEEYYDKFHDYLRSTKKQSSLLSINSVCSNRSSVFRTKPHGILSSSHRTQSNRSVHVKDDGDVKIFEDKIKKIVKVKRFVNDDGTMSEVREKITIKIKPDNESLSVASSESTKTVKDTKDAKSLKSCKKNDRNIAFCSASFNSLGFQLPIRKAKSEAVFVIQPITVPCLRQCISLTVCKHPDLDLTYESSHSFVENLYEYSEICN